MSNNQRSALLIGADPYTIRACLEHDIRPVVVHGPMLRSDGYVLLPDGVETVFTEDTTSVGGVLASLRRAGVRERAFAFVQTSLEEALLVTAALGVVLGVSAIAPDVAVLFRDKWLQKRAVAAAGVAVAASQVIDDIYDPDPATFAEFTKAVLKPIAGGGTTNTSVVHGRAELIEQCAEYRRRGIAQHTFVLEEFVSGDEWMVDGVLFEGKLQFLSVGTYAQSCLSTVTANAAVQLELFDPTADAHVYELVRPVAETALRALGLHNGVFHMEFFHQPETGKLYFGECAARVGGGPIREQVRHKFDVDLNRAAVLCAAGIDPQVTPSVRSETVGSTYLVGRPGILVGYPTPADVEALPGVQFVRLETPYGSRLDDVADTNMRVGQVMLSGATPEEFRARRDFVVEWFAERLLVVPAEATTRDLRTWQRAHWPESASQHTTFAND